MSVDSDLAPVRLSRLSRRGVILGLSTAQVSSMSIGLVVVVVSLYAGGGRLTAWTSPVWLTTIVLAFLPVGGRPAVEWLPVTLTWGWRLLGGRTSYRRLIVRPEPVGTLTLPGDTTALQEYLDPPSGAVMLHDPQQRWLIAIAEVTHRSFVLLDGGEQQRRVTAWGRVLATACRSGRIARLQVLERTVPDSGDSLAAWWAEHGSDDDSWVSATYQDLIGRAGPTAERHVTTVSIALDMAAAGRAIKTAGRGLPAAAAVLRQEMATFTTALGAADLTNITWATPDRLAVTIRSAYDPQIAGTLNRHPSGGALANAGPIAIDETWDRLRSDSGFHAVLWIADWPRSQVYPGFLAPLLLTGGVRRAFSLICEPVRADRAARTVRRRKTEHVADAAQRVRIGQVEDARHTAEYHDVLQQEAELADGHGLLRYTGLLAITAPTTQALDSAVAQIEQAAIQASCDTRRLVGQQAQAFVAAALPLCRGI